jgi:UDP-N-acetylglucosamine--N-acetylmuramyl-(pentapeptide) pyrophosphoryl-undecaprenol N-acetylglucosamine transferase
MMDRKNRKPLVVLAGGGTGGHLYPMLSIARELRARSPGVRLAFFSTQREIDRQIVNAVFPSGEPNVEQVPQEVRPMPRTVRGWPAFLKSWIASVRSCMRCFRLDQPDLVIGSGGFGCAPPIRAAARLGIPRVLLNPDAVPGFANRRLAKQADAVFAQWPVTKAHLPKKATVHVTGCPIRPEFRCASRDAGLRKFELDESRQTLLITGASQGARSINLSIIAILDQLTANSAWQYLHLTGRDDAATVRQAYRKHEARATVIEYTEFMPHALAAADLVVSRAGASTLAEITAMGVPSVLMPYPYHRDRHQWANAAALADAGAATIVEDKVRPDLNAEPLAETLARLMKDNEALAAMGTQATRLGRPNATTDIVTQVMELANITSAPRDRGADCQGVRDDWRESGSRVDDRNGAVASGPLPG